jgi:transcriptional antiterminator RfaH
MNTGLLTQSLPGITATHQWAVLHVRPRCEKKIADYCASRNISFYLPLLHKSHRYGGRTRSFDSPLFSGYVFALVDPMEKSHLRQHQRVANILDVHNQKTLLHQLEQIKCALDNQAAVELFPHLAAGMKVTVQAGPLKGVEGYIERLKNKTKIILNVDFIQKAISVEVNAEWLLPV